MKPISIFTDGFFYINFMQTLYSHFIASSGVQTDTRQITPNCIFFCLKGANFDGNRFASEAIEKGARLVVIDNADYAIGNQTLLVPNVLIALQELAHHHRMQMNIPVIGITGSNGKTTSKELIATLLSTQYNVLFTKGNFNNHIGVPLTLLQLRSEHELAIIEMGANKPGDIKELAEIAAPNYGIITNIGRAHLEGFGSLEGVIRTKSELYDYLSLNKGTIFYHAADPILIKQLPENCAHYSYGTTGNISGNLVALNPFVQFTWNEGTYSSPVLTSQLIGDYNFTNFLAAICIGRFFSISADNCNRAIEAYIPTNNRSQVTKTEHNTIIVDCYNANPTSMQSAIRSFSQLAEHSKIFILGDMREMGNDAAMVHEEIVQLTIDLRLSGFFIGEEFLRFKGMHPQAIFLKSTEPLIEHFSQNPPSDLWILLKGSRGIALEKVLPYL